MSREPDSMKFKFHGSFIHGKLDSQVHCADRSGGPSTEFLRSSAVLTADKSGFTLVCSERKLLRNEFADWCCHYAQSIKQ